MKKAVLITALLAISASVWGQSGKVWVFLSDKGPQAETLLQQPEKYLSAKAIYNRQLQGIEIDFSDLPVYSPYVQGIENVGVTLEEKSKWFNAVSVSYDNPIELEAISHLPFVVGTQPVRSLVITRESNYVPADEADMKQMTFNYGVASNNIYQIKGAHVHDMGYKGQGMTIAVLDGGFFGADSYQAFDSIYMNGRVLGTWNFVANNANIYDIGSHGMSVLSTMGGYDEGTIIGTAPLASYYLLKTENDTAENRKEEDNWVAGAEYADSVGAQVINTSLGYSVFDDPSENYTYQDMDGRTTIIAQGAVWAARKGIIVCASAGNEGGSSWRYITSPADADSILTMGAVDNSGNRASFSSVGPSADGRIKPDVMALGAGAGLVYNGGFAGFGNGTSFSSPIIAGMVACLWQSNPNRTNQEIIQMVRESADNFNTPDSLNGYGIPNFTTALEKVISVPENVKFTPTISVFPNPFQGSLNFEMTEDWIGEEVSLSLVNFAGQTLWESTVEDAQPSHTLDMPANLPKGIYFMVFSSGQQTEVQKLIHE